MKQIFNPFLPEGEYVPDGEPHVFGDRVYLYGSHDSFDGFMFCANDYVVYSAPVNDLKSWTCHGIVYTKTDDPINPKGRMEMWAPDIQQGPDGRYYLYYGHLFTTWISVAVGDGPAGPFRYYGKVRYPNGDRFGTRRNDATPFDPGVFVDDDGRIFLYTGFAPKGRHPFICRNKLLHEGAYVLELEKDMLTVKQGPKLLAPDVHHSKGTGYEGHEFFEASSMRKFNGRYYFIYSSINGHELCYAISDRPDSGFEYGGILVSSGDIGLDGRAPEDAIYYTANNHGSVEKIGEKYYIFYHRHTAYCQTSRQACAEEITMLPDGRFAQAEVTSCGLNGGALAGEGYYPAYSLCHLRSREGCFFYPYYSNALTRKKAHPYITQTGRDGTPWAKQYIRNFCRGSVAGYKYFDLRETNTVTLTVSGEASGQIEVLPGPDQEPIARLTITEGTHRRKLQTAICIRQPRAALYFRMQGSGSLNVYGFELSK